MDLASLKGRVVITCYNYGKYLGGCLESILNERFRNVEIIVVNYGSSDETNDVLGGFDEE